MAPKLLLNMSFFNYFWAFFDSIEWGETGKVNTPRGTHCIFLQWSFRFQLYILSIYLIFMPSSGGYRVSLHGQLHKFLAFLFLFRCLLSLIMSCLYFYEIYCFLNCLLILKLIQLCQNPGKLFKWPVLNVWPLLSSMF